MPKVSPPSPRQLLLDVTPQLQYRFDNFVVGSNALLIKQLQGFCLESGPDVLYMWGESGSGCSHLLQASCEFAQANGKAAAYIPLKVMLSQPPEFLDGYEQLDLLVIDDLQCLRGRQSWQQALFHLFNRSRERGGSLLLAANESLAGLNFELKDLMSRLSLGANYALKPIDDELKHQFLQNYCQQAGITITSEVLSFILSRSQRGLAQLKTTLDQLAELGLRDQRALTIPLVKEVTGW